MKATAKPTAKKSTVFAAIDAIVENTKKIDDFGDKIGGAKKDKYTKTVADISASDWETLPLSKLIPPIKPADFDDVATAAACHVIRATIERRPVKSYKLTRWINGVKTIAGIIEQIKSGAIDSPADFIPSKFKDMFELFQVLPVELWSKVDDVANYKDCAILNHQTNSYDKTPRFNINKTGFYYVDNWAETLPRVIDLLSENESKKDISFACYRETSTGVRFICAKSDKEKRHLIEFKTREEMHDFYVNNRPALVELWEQTKERDNVTEKSTRRAVNDAKTGAFFRSGDISPVLFNETFKFKGVEFGNWVSQGGGGRQRQWMLNRAFDGLIDLSRLLNIEPAALSLGGSLSLAFGARGNSGASAHFESSYFVINLTKNNGAGSLAHEWFHALDNYLSKQNGDRLGFATDKPENYGVELSPALVGLVSALNDSPMKARATLIDKGKSKKYWSTMIEMAARSFECFVIDGLQQIGVKNDYLANVTTFTEFAKNGGRYPYQTSDELPPVSAAFSQLFAVLKQSSPVFSADFAMVEMDLVEAAEVAPALTLPTPKPAKISVVVMPFENEKPLTIGQIIENRVNEFKAIDLFTGEPSTLSIFANARNARAKKFKSNIKRLTRLYFGTYEGAPIPTLIGNGYKVALEYMKLNKPAPVYHFTPRAALRDDVLRLLSGATFQSVVKVFDATKWDLMPMSERVAMVKSKGFEGKTASKAWRDIDEKIKITLVCDFYSPQQQTTALQAAQPTPTLALKPKLSAMARAGIMILGWFFTRELFNAAGQGKIRAFLSQGLKMAWNFDGLTDADFSRFFAVCDDDTKRTKVYALYTSIMPQPKSISDFDRHPPPLNLKQITAQCHQQ